MNLLTCISAVTTLFVLELIYFKIANIYNVIDYPNHRSSHSRITIRGGGIIFSLALLLSPLYLGWEYSYFLLGLGLISTISFIDDIKTISSRTRIFFHFVAVIFLFYQVGIYTSPFYLILIALIVVIGAINAINFMDGINGMTGGYGMVTLLTLYYINVEVIHFTKAEFLVISILATIVFNFFNFRVKAKCFAGDVGSVSLAFIMLFFILQLIIKTNNVIYILLLLLYGLDTATTILFRLWRKEKIFEAHRSHYYQFLANEKKIPHLIVSIIYTASQLLINIILIVISLQQKYLFILITTVSTIIFICLRFITEGYDKLLRKRDGN